MLEAADGAAAMWVAKGYGQAIHLLLTDVVLPGMSGQELSQQIQQVCPGISVLYTSGYISNTPSHQDILEPEAVLLLKPFTPHMLGTKVREVLDNTAMEFA